MDATIEMQVRSPGLDQVRPRVVVILPTFRRPEHLVRTLATLEAQKVSQRLAVIVMENEAEAREGLAAARPFFETGRLDGLVIVAHERGNCSAYNAGFTTALDEFASMEFCLVIDDDELASHDWAARLVETAEHLQADLVGGPQVPVFEGEEAERMARHPVFTPHYSKTGLVPILYSSGNVLIRRRVLEAMERPFLDPAFNFLGGGDSDFYSRCRKKGFCFAWCAEAPVHETTPSRRTEFSWLNARGLRNGAISSIIERRRNSTLAGRARSLLKSGALLAASPFRAVKLAVRTRSAVIGLYPMQVAIGRFQGEIGVVNEQYRQPEQN